MTTEQKNNAITAYLGGAEILRKLLGHPNDADFDFTSVSDLKFHSSWDWLIPAWSKIRFEMTPIMVIVGVNCIDEANFDELYKLISNVATEWCKTKNIPL
jgi:hypothetical protein